MGRRRLIDELQDTVHYVEDLDASEKPTKDEIVVETPMSKAQVGLYRLSMKGMDPTIQEKIQTGGPMTRKEEKALFTRLQTARRISNSLYGSVKGLTLEQAAEATPKVKKLLDDTASHIKGTADAQIVIYTNMVKGGVDVISAGLRSRGIPFGVVAGKGVQGVTEKSRQQAVEDYLKGDVKVILITGAGAEGLSLGNTTMVQVADGHYNPERTSQAEARGIRAGGLSHRAVEDRKVAVKKYVSTIPRGFFQKIFFRPPEKSIDEWVYQTAQGKTDVNKQLRDVLADRSEYDKKRRENLFFRLLGGDAHEHLA